MDDRQPSVKCACGHSFVIPPEMLSKDVGCPKCGKHLPAAAANPAAPKSEPLKASRSEASPPPKPKSENLTSSRSEASAPPKETSTGTKTDPAAPKHDTTKGGTPGTTRRPPLFVKEGPLPAPIPGYTFIKRLGQGGMGEVFLAKQ